MKQYLSDIFIIVAAAWLLTACSSDEPQQDARDEGTFELRAMTRGTGDGDRIGDDIHVFLMDDQDNTMSQGLFKYCHEDATETEPAKDYWTAQSLKVKPGTRSFILYGYMPVPAVEGLTGTPDFSNRTLTLRGLEPISNSDIYIITGVKKSETVLTAEDLPRGTYTFDYVNSAYNDYTVLNLRLEHLYGRLTFMFKIDEEYAQLRKIKVTSLKIRTKTTNTVVATVTLPNTEDGDVTVSYATATGTEEKTWESDFLSIDDNTDDIWLTTNAQKMGSANVAVGAGLSSSYELESTYEVYDLDTTKLSTRKAVNKLTGVNPPESATEKDIVLTIKPTYIYQLSDEDLDNPQ